MKQRLTEIFEDARGREISQLSHVQAVVIGVSSILLTALAIALPYIR